MAVSIPEIMAKKATRKASKKSASKAKSKTLARKSAPKARPSAKKAKTKSAPKRPKAGSEARAGASASWTTAEITEAFRRLRDLAPEPQTELQYVNPFTLLVAVVLSAQATDVGVNKATPALFAAADTPAKMAALGEDQVRELIKTIGLFRTKAKNVVELSRRLVAEHSGEVPRSREALEALPGVGRKTANVVLNVAFGEPTIAVDTHIFRVGNRTGIAPGKNPLEVELKLEQAIPAEFKRHAHHWLILHGRYTCIARKPLCGRCIISDLCKWSGKMVVQK
jgi:endonuclease III